MNFQAEGTRTHAKSSGGGSKGEFVEMKEKGQCGSRQRRGSWGPSLAHRVVRPDH